MILPIYLYGEPVLRKEAEEVPEDYPNLKELAENMFQTMEKANGVGLAAPQVGLALRMFVVDGNGLAEDYPECLGVRRCMINPEVVEESKETNVKDEGCLSIPGVYEGCTSIITSMERCSSTVYRLCANHSSRTSSRLFSRARITPITSIALCAERGCDSYY